MSYNFWLRIKNHKDLPDVEAYVEKENRDEAVQHFITLIKENSGVDVTKEQIDEFVLLQLD